jgi:Zn-dependent protease with chaperone function
MFIVLDSFGTPLLFDKNFKTNGPFFYTHKQPPTRHNKWPAFVICLFSVFTVLVISTNRINKIKMGGGTYMPSLLKATPFGDGGIFLNPEGERQEKILRNVVSELAVVANIPEPDLYIMLEENSINAMASGLDLDNSSIIITKGVLRYLDRDEIMALLAHEFSHLVNNDTKHFTIMAGWLHGLLILKTIGFNLAHNVSHLFVLVLALIISMFGFFGNLMGSIIQSAFSRSRERLADHTAAQFTRDPLALASVLKKIGGQDAPKRSSNLRLPEFRHLYIAEAPSIWKRIKPPQFILQIFSTHPPLEDRVWELEPEWDGWYYDFEKNPVDYLAHSNPAQLPLQPAPTPPAAPVNG